MSHSYHLHGEFGGVPKSEVVRLLMKKAVKLVEFENNKGQKLLLPDTLTIADLVRMGFTQFRIMKPEEPLPDNWWRDKGEDR